MSLYDKYYDILKHVYKIMNLTDNVELKELSKKTIIDMIDQLCKKDSKNKKAYEGILEEFGFKKIIEEKNSEINVSNNLENKIEESVINNDLSEELKNDYQSKTEKKEDILKEEINENKLDDNLIKNDLREEITEDQNIEKKEEGLKIKNVKRSFNSSLKNRTLSLLALVGIGSFNPLIATGIGIGGYYLYKKGIKNAKSLIEKNGLKLDENDNLLDYNNNPIKEEDIGKLKYHMIKRELSKINNKGRINIDYKKNKLTSMLLQVPSKIFNNIKDKYKKIKVSKEEDNIEIKDMNKGMELIK